MEGILRNDPSLRGGKWTQKLAWCFCFKCRCDFSSLGLPPSWWSISWIVLCFGKQFGSVLRIWSSGMFCWSSKTKCVSVQGSALHCHIHAEWTVSVGFKDQNNLSDTSPCTTLPCPWWKPQSLDLFLVRDGVKTGCWKLQLPIHLFLTPVHLQAPAPTPPPYTTQQHAGWAHLVESFTVLQLLHVPDKYSGTPAKVGSRINWSMLCIDIYFRIVFH